MRKNVTCTCLYWCLGRIIPLSLWKSSMSPPRYTTQTACILFFSMLLSLEVLRALVLRNNAVSREVGSSFATGETLENHHFTAPLPVEMAAVGPNDGNEGRCSGPQTADLGQNLARTLVADRDKARDETLCQSKACTIPFISPASTLER